jgi:hypothetical protein
MEDEAAAVNRNGR